MVKTLIDFFLAISFLLPQFLGLTVDLLELLQPKPDTINTGFIRFFIGKFILEGILQMPELWQSVSSVGKDLMLRQEAWNCDIEIWN